MMERTNKIKRSILVMAGIALLSGMVISGCKKDDDFKPTSNIVTAVAPANNGIVNDAASLDLKWTGASGTKYNVYFGEAKAPSLYKSGITTQTINVPVTGGRTYYWQVGTVDANGEEKLSQVYTFKVKVLLDLEKFTGLFDCDEPKYAHYDVNFTKAGKDTLQVDNFWDLQWKLNYVFDEMGKVTIVPATFSPDASLKVSVTGTGAFDNEKKEIKISYVVLQDASADSPLAIEIDRNTHTYIKK